jgi:hypothetical protein
MGRGTVFEIDFHEIRGRPMALATGGWVISLVLVGLVALAQSFGLDMILGAGTAGLIVALANRGEQLRILHQKLDAIGFGFLIPIFFVTSGIKFDLSALIEGPIALLRVPLYLLFLAIRGLPVFLYRGDLQQSDLPPRRPLLQPTRAVSYPDNQIGDPWAETR